VFSHFCEGSFTDVFFAITGSVVIEGGEFYIYVPLLRIGLLEVFWMSGAACVILAFKC
jgi:hypothetical protein